MKKGVSIVISTTDSAGSKHLFLSKTSLTIYLIITGLLLTIIIAAIINYGRLSYRAVEAEVLHRRNEKIEKEFSKIQGIKKNLELVENNNRKLKIMLGIDKTPESVQPAINDISNQYTNSDTLGMDEKNVPSLTPTRGQISKKFEIGHEAIDIAAPLFTPVIATAEGRISETGWDSLYGNYLVIEHSKNYSTFYGHLNATIGMKNDIVKPGELVGTVGSSGKSTSPHLHYEIRFQGRAVDPMAYLPYFLDK